MALREHPARGLIVTCNYETGFRPPEMAKLRPVIVLSPRIRQGHHIRTVVPLSTTAPSVVMPYHLKIDLAQKLPARFSSKDLQAKSDMINAVSLERLDFIRSGKDSRGKICIMSRRSPTSR